MKTWNIRKWKNRPEATQKIGLCCPFCATDAQIEIGVPVGASIIASVGLGLIFDPPRYVPPDNLMPDEIKCRTCRKIFSNDGRPGYVR